MVETTHFEILETDEEFQIRKYPGMMVATVFGEDDDISFRRLFRYITGFNAPNQSISMTAPVISNLDAGKEIGMTVPVISGGTRFSFVLPEGMTQENAPVPKDPKVVLEETPEKTLVVIKFRGYTGEKYLAAKKRLLDDFIAQRGFLTTGDPILMRYNGPFTPGLLRHNELAYELRT